MATEQFFVLERQPDMKITLNKTPQKYFDTDIFEKYSDIREKVALTKNSTIIQDRDKIKALIEATSSLFGSNYLELIFHMKNDLEYFNYKDVIRKSTNSYYKNHHKRYTNIVSTMQNYDEIKEKHMCNREQIYARYWLHRYLLAFNHLKPDGNMLLPIVNLCHPETVDLIYLGLMIFKKIIIYRGSYIYYETFSPISSVTHKTISNLLDSFPKLFTITPKQDLILFEKYMKHWYTQLYRYNKDIYDKKYELVIEKTYKDFVSKIEDVPDSSFYDKALPIIYQKFYEFFKHLYIDNDMLKIHSGIKTPEGLFLKNLVAKKKFQNIVEVGMAFGISAMFITTGFDMSNVKGKLISIDPFQTEQWKDNGVKLLKTLKLSKYHELIQKKSYIALPELLAKYGENYFDMLFIDGWHTFDYTLVDVFYADKLVKPNGYIIVDDALHFSVQQCIKYIDTNYKHLKRIQAPKTFAAYKKLENDKRDWNFHVKFT